MKTDNFIKNFKDNRRILELQQNLEKGIIKETDLSEEEKSKLINLYKEQIYSLRNDIEQNKRSLQNYKEKILNIRRKI